jgi:AcrR family transcriptional regulator
MEYHHGNLKEALINAGDEELKVTGIEQLSLRTIAQRAGVSHNAPYRHFQSKADLIDHLIDKSLKEWAEQISSADMLYPASIIMQVQYVGRLYAGMTMRHPRKAHLLMGGQNNSQLQAGHKLILQSITSLLEGVRGSELLRETPVDVVAVHMVVAFRGLCMLYITKAAEELLPTSEALLELSDEIAENILRPYLS